MIGNHSNHVPLLAVHPSYTLSEGSKAFIPLKFYPTVSQCGLHASRPFLSIKFFSLAAPLATFRKISCAFSPHICCSADQMSLVHTSFTNLSFHRLPRDFGEIPGVQFLKRSSGTFLPFCTFRLELGPHSRSSNLPYRPGLTFFSVLVHFCYYVLFRPASPQ